MSANRRQRGFWCRLIVRFGVLVLLSSTAVYAKPVQERNRYCVRSVDGEWSVQGYPPLIDLHTKLTFEQVMYDGAILKLVRVRRFDPAYELMMEYRFDSDGKVVATHGLLRRWSRWVAQAVIYPADHGTVKKPDVKFYNGLGGNEMTEPDDGELYVGLFESAPVYGKFEDIPCAGLLKEAEKKNATQE